MYKVEYWFNGKLEKTFSFSTEEKATEFYEPQWQIELL